MILPTDRKKLTPEVAAPRSADLTTFWTVSVSRPGGGNNPLPDRTAGWSCAYLTCRHETLKSHIGGPSDQVWSEQAEAARGIRILVELEPEDAARTQVHERGQRLVEPLCLCFEPTVLIGTHESGATGQTRLGDPDGPVANSEPSQGRLELREALGRRIGRQVVVNAATSKFAAAG